MRPCLILNVQETLSDKFLCHYQKWEDNIRMDIGGIGWKVVDWIHLAQNRDKWRALMNTVMDLGVPYGGEFID
jgi:hypothetical protein